MKKSLERIEHVRYEKRGKVAYVTLDRPEVLNAMDSQMHEELLLVWEDLESDPQVWVGVVSGAGDRAFSVGQDLKETARLDSTTDRLSTFGSRGRPGAPRITDRFDLTKPLIAKVNGYALGGGFELVMACDLIVASLQSEFGLPEVKLGLVAGAGGVFRIARQMPPRIAAGYLLTGQRMTAQEAMKYGLVNEIAEATELDSAVNAWVEKILACAPLAVRSAKQAMWSSLEMPIATAFEKHFPAEEIRRNSADAREGPRSFVERRPPAWSGD